MELTTVILLALVGVCGLTDLYRGKVYDAVTWPAAVFGLLLNSSLAAGLGFWPSAGGFLLGFGCLYALFLTGKMGGGDVKLMAAVGALKGLAFVYAVLIYSFLVGAGVALLYLIWDRGSRGRGQGQDTPRTGDEVGPAVPFGAAICLASLWALAEEITHRSIVDWFV